MASKRPQTKEEAILKPQKFALIYAQLGYLYTIILDAPRTNSSCRDTSGESHAVDGVIGSITHHPHFYKSSPLIPPYFDNTPNVSQLVYALDYLCVMSRSVARPSYVPPTLAPHVHRTNCLTLLYNVQMVRFIAPLTTIFYYPPIMQHTLTLIPKPLAPPGQVYT